MAGTTLYLDLVWLVAGWFAQGCGQRGRLCKQYFMMGVFSIFFLLLHFFLLGTIFAISSKADSICAFSKIHQGSLLYFAIHGILEMWKREGKIVSGEKEIDDDLVGQA
jgi:hypothetical protein